MKMKAYNLLITLLAMNTLTLGIVAQTQTDLKDSFLYQEIQQSSKSWTFYKYTISNKQYQQNSQYIVITADAEDAYSDPDIFISKTNQYPTSLSNSDQYCVSSGSDICFLSQNYASYLETIYIGIQCIEECHYQLKISYVSVTSLNDGASNTYTLTGRNISVYQAYIPQMQANGLTDSISFSLNTYNIQSSLQIYFSLNSDFTSLEQRPEDLLTENGKTYRFTSDDNGWCSECFVYFIISTNATTSYTVSLKTSIEKEWVTDQTYFNKQLVAKRNECFPYNVSKSINEIRILSSIYQGNAEIQFQTKDLITYEPSNIAVVKSDSYPSLQQIVRNIDRLRQNTITGLYYFCFTPAEDTSLQFYTNQKFYQSRFEINDGQMTVFYLESRDFLYFVYSNYQLSQRQNLTVTVKASNTNYQPPRIVYRVCQSPISDECALTDLQAATINNQNGMTLVNGTVDNNTKTRVGVIDHLPSSCPFPMNCHYLISIYNPEYSGTMKIQLTVSINKKEALPLQLFQQYVNTVAYNEYHFFQLTFTPQQISAYSITGLIINLQTYNGRTELYMSTKTTNPSRDNYEMKARSLSQTNQIYINPSNIDLTAVKYYIGVYGSVYSSYQLRTDAVYTPKYPSYYSLPQTQTTQVSANTTSSNISSIIMIEQEAQSVNLNSNNSQVYFYFQPTDDIIQNNKSIIIVPQVLLQHINASYYLNISYQNYTWNNINSQLIIDQNSTLKFSQNTNLTIKAVGQFKGATTAVVNKKTVIVSYPNVTISLKLYSAKKLESKYNEANINSTFETYSNGETYLFKHLLMDSNSTYQYTIEKLLSDFDNPYLMVENGYSEREMNYLDDSTFDFATLAVDSPQTISIDKSSREQANIQCKNASYPIRGGNENCSVYFAVSCQSFCSFRVSITQQYVVNKTNDIPRLLQLNTPFEGSVARNKTIYYYLPFMRGQISNDIAFILNERSNDSILYAKIISNAYLAYYNWTYPTNSSNDGISYTANSNYELLEISNSTIYNKCPNNASCALIIGVQGNANLNTSNSTFTLTYLSANNKLSNIAQFTKYIENSGTYDYYWFTVTSRNKTGLTKWYQSINAGVLNDNTKDIDIYVSAVTGNFPTSNNYDYKSDKYGSDLISLSYEDDIFKNYYISTKVLFIVAVKTLNDQSTYTLLNWGTDQANSTFLNFTDLTLNIASNYTFVPRSSKEGQYKIFKFFNYGVRDFQVNITCTNGQISYLSNNLPYQSSSNNAYLSIPLYSMTSKTSVTTVSKGKYSLLQIMKSSDVSGLWCQLCWYYVVVFQNATAVKDSSTVSVKVTEMQDGGQFVQELKVQSTHQPSFIEMESGIQRKFILDSRDPFIVNVSTQNSGVSIKVYIGLFTDYANNENIWESEGTGSLTLTVPLKDSRFTIGQYYYLSVVSSSDEAIKIDMSVTQNKVQVLLKNGETYLDKMWTSQDFVKYYYYVAPSTLTNYTVQFIVQSLTPGFQPTIYIKRNDYLNITSLDYTNITFPSITSYTQMYEKQFYPQPVNLTTSISFNVTSQNLTSHIPINVTTQKNITNQTTKKTQTVNVTSIVNYTVYTMNMTYYTIAVYWNNYGFTDNQKAQFEVTCNLLSPQQRVLSQSLQSSPLKQQFQLKDKTELKLKNLIHEKTIQNRFRERIVFDESDDDMILN